MILCLAAPVRADAAKKAAVKPKALIVDYKGENDTRVGKCLKKAGFKVYRIRKMKKVRKMKAKKYNCLVIPGGHNVTPELYGAERQKETYGTDLDKDRMQIKAIRKFVRAKVPVLGICRGSQIVNVALGGTLYQHLPDTGWHRNRRTIRMSKASWLYKTFGKKEKVVHSHHQAVKRLARGLVATAWDDEDGIIEEYKHKTLPIYAVQWHPDCMKGKGRRFFKVFRAIVVNNMKKKSGKKPGKKPKPQEGTTQEVKPEEGTTQDLPPEEGTTQDLPPEEGTTQDSGGQDPAATTEKK